MDMTDKEIEELLSDPEMLELWNTPKCKYWKPCPRCEGSGKILVPWSIERDWHYDDCPECDGYGYFPDE